MPPKYADASGWQFFWTRIALKNFISGVKPIHAQRRQPQSWNADEIK
jgi:hypothetical protein